MKHERMIALILLFKMIVVINYLLFDPYSILNKYSSKSLDLQILSTFIENLIKMFLLAQLLYGQHCLTSTSRRISPELHQACFQHKVPKGHYIISFLLDMLV